MPLSAGEPSHERGYMHKVIVAALGAALLASGAPAQEVATPIAAPAVTAPAGSKIIMYRPSALMGYALGCPIRYKGQEVVELGRGKYAEWDVQPGHYILTNKTGSVDIRVANGETAYVRCQIKTGMMTGRADLQIVDQESFAEHQANFEKKDAEIPAPTVGE